MKKDIERYIREDLRGWQNYQVQPVSGRKMDANESPFLLSQEVKEYLSRWILEKEDLHYYPDTDNTVLREKIAAFYQVDPSWVTCGVGSDQLIDYLTKLFLEPGDSILVPSPSFSMYQVAAEINHGKAEAFVLDGSNDFYYSAEAVIEALERIRPKMLFLCSPNNPTGRAIEEDVLEEVLEQADCIVVLDEAYGEFARQDHIGLVSKYSNLVLLKTFSKAYGLAGLRVGYAVAQPELIRGIDTVRAPYNLNTFSQEAAAFILGRPEYQEHIRFIVNERERIYRSILPLEGKQGFYCYPSQANFLFMRSDRTDLFERLKERGLLVRGYGGAMQNYIRASAAEEDANTRLIESLKEIFS